MALTIDWPGQIVNSDSSILDLAAFHVALRDLEDDPIAMVYPIIHNWRALSLGGGAYFYQVDFINGWQLKFPTPGNYTIKGNLNATIVPVAGVFVDRLTSAAYSTTSVGGGGPSAGDIAAALLSGLMSTTIAANLVQVRGQPINGSGSSADPWGP